jgi:hypothetical protein
MRWLNFIPLLVGIWGTINGILHNYAVWKNHEGNYDRELLRLLMDWLLLWTVGIVFIIGFWLIRKGISEVWWLLIAVAFSLTLFSVMILPFFKSKAFVGLAITILLLSISGKLFSQTKNINNMTKEKVIIEYFNSWNEKDELKRKVLLESSFAKNGIYLDPHIPKPVSNIEEMNQIIMTFHSRLPHKLVKNSEPEFHNSIFRIQWKMDDDGSILSYGTFVGEFDEANRINRVYCFIDKFLK